MDAGLRMRVKVRPRAETSSKAKVPRETELEREREGKEKEYRGIAEILILLNRITSTFDIDIFALGISSVTDIFVYSCTPEQGWTSVRVIRTRYPVDRRCPEPARNTLHKDDPLDQIKNIL